MPDFRINPLQLPDAIRPTPLDFRPIGEIGDVVAERRRKDQIAAALGSATDPSGNIDVEKAGTALARIGEDPRPFLALAQQKAALAQSTSHQKFQEGIAQQNLDLANKQFEASQNEASTLPYGGGLYRKKTGEVLLQPQGAGEISDEDATAYAHQARAGDTSVFVNLARGVSGERNLLKVRSKLAEINRAAGETGTEQAQRNAEMFGEKAGQRTLGTRTANIELPAAEFQQMAPLALDASKSVDRTRFPNLNAITNAIARGIGDENIVRFNAANNTLVNVYSRAVSPTGVPTDAQRKHAYDILDTAYSKGQYAAAVDMMQQEIAAARRSPASVQQGMREKFQQGLQPGGAPAPTPPPSAPAPVQRPAQVRNPSPDAQQFLLANPDTRDDFDAHYGAGASDRILGRRK